LRKQTYFISLINSEFDEECDKERGNGEGCDGVEGGHGFNSLGSISAEIESPAFLASIVSLRRVSGLTVIPSFTRLIFGLMVGRDMGGLKPAFYISSK
jgi:hypothetical protein